MHSPDDEAVCGLLRTWSSPNTAQLDRVGLFGCLAIDSLYNVYHPSDPVAYVARTLDPQSLNSLLFRYKLNATVDSK